jgi:predicted amidohydrolase YtcJ
MSKIALRGRASLLLLTLLAVGSCGQQPADLILKNAVVYTMEEEQPTAGVVVISGNTITAVLGPGEDTAPYEASGTRVIDMEGAFIMPGFIDSHTHFDGYGSILNDADLMASRKMAGSSRNSLGLPPSCLRVSG